MDEFLSRTLAQLLERPAGPFSFRFLMQPLMAAFIAFRAGLNDCRANRPAYLWTVVFNPAERQILIQGAWKDIRRLFLMGFLLDSIYQIFVLRWFYPGQALIVAFFLAVVPYVLIRGPVTRIAAICRGWSFTWPAPAFRLRGGRRAAAGARTEGLPRPER